MMMPRIDDTLFRTALHYTSVARIMQPLTTERLKREFDPECAERCLLLYQDDRLAEPQFSPFLRGIGRLRDVGISVRAVNAVKPVPERLLKTATTIMYQPCFGQYATLDVSAVEALRQASPDAWIVFCDWFAPCDIRFAEGVEPYIDIYAKKSLLQDKASYVDDVRAHTNLMDFYSRFFAIDYPTRTWTTPAAILPKLRLTPSFSTSSQLYRRFQDDMPNFRPSDIDVHARLQTKGSGWYGNMRQLAYERVSQMRKYKLAKDGMVSKSKYMDELARSHLCFSPFGYGELCWRDFEAFAVGAVLIKPDMSHLDVMGDVFRPGETYLPVAWDLSDLDVVIDEALSDRTRLQTIAVNAYNRVQDTLNFQSSLAYLKSLTRTVNVRTMVAN